MSRTRFFSLTLTLLLAAALGYGLWQLTNRPESLPELLERFNRRQETESGPLVASGFIEADEIDVASEYGGRVVSVTVDEGDTVVAGQLLVTLDTTLLDAQIQAAQAAVEVAEARRDQVAAGVRPETLEVARAEVARAQAAANAAHQAWQDAILLRDNPQALQLEIAAAQTRLQIAEHQLAQAEALRDAAAVGYERFNDVMDEIGPDQRVEIASGPLLALAPLLQQLLPPEVYQQILAGGDGTYSGNGYEVVVAGGVATVYQKVGLQLDFHLLPNAYWQAGASVNAAQATRDGARAALNHLNDLVENPQAAQAQVDAAYSAYLAAQAGVSVAQASLDALEAGATSEELAVAQAQIEQARAALATLQTQGARSRLTAPQAGLVTRRHITAGELAAPGLPLLTLADLSRLTLTVYVPVPEMGRVYVGQPVEVAVDAFPERRFPGTVTAIAEEAEFTPSATQTQGERVKLVFAVKISLPNDEGALKPGMPADATFQENADENR